VAGDEPEPVPAEDRPGPFDDPPVLVRVVDVAGVRAQINYSVFAGILVGLVTELLFDRYHTIQLPSYLGFFGGRRFVPIVVSVASLVMGFALIRR
jgi:PTS system N-acetylglucosamine-specific IIC component